MSPAYQSPNWTQVQRIERFPDGPGDLGRFSRSKRVATLIAVALDRFLDAPL